MRNEIKIVITLDNMKLISVNALYRAGILYRGGKPVPYIYKVSEAKKFESILDNQLRAIDWTEHLGWLAETKYFTITNQYILKSGLNSRDVSNFTKCADDCVTRFIHDELGIKTFDDSKFIDEHLYKSILPGSDKEFLCICLAPSTFDFRYDRIQKPQQALIHFELDTDISWNNTKFRKMMKEKAVGYQLCNTTRKIKEHDTNIFLIDSTGKNKLDLITGLYDYIYAHKDNTGDFTYYGFYQSTDQDLVNKINSFGLANIQASLIVDGNVSEFIENII